MNRPMSCRADRRGNVSVFVAGFIVVAMLLGAAVARLGSAAAQKARANNAADASALAAADGLALGRTPTESCAIASVIAASNGARLLTCHCTESVADVSLAIEAARARARAEVASGDEPGTRSALTDDTSGP